MYRVYRIKNHINGKSYIGITSRLVEERFQDHLSRARNEHRFSRLYMAMRKYDVQNFTVEELATSEDENAIRKMEEFFIRKFDTYQNGYNCNYGGYGFLKFPDEIRKKISQGQIGKIISLETRKKMSMAKLGDSRCADHFGEYTKKGNKNPRSRYFEVQFPDEHTEIICGLREFCRKYKIKQCSLSSRGKSKGFVLVRRFTDHPEREYVQADGSGAYPVTGKDMVGSAWQHAAVPKRTDII